MPHEYCVLDGSKEYIFLELNHCNPLFNPYSMTSFVILVWVKMVGISMDLWSKKGITDLGNMIDYTIYVDQSFKKYITGTITRDFVEFYIKHVLYEILDIASIDNG